MSIRTFFSEEIKRADSFLPDSFTNYSSNLLNMAIGTRHCSAPFDLQPHAPGAFGTEGRLRCSQRQSQGLYLQKDKQVVKPGESPMFKPWSHPSRLRDGVRGCRSLGEGQTLQISTGMSDKTYRDVPSCSRKRKGGKIFSFIIVDKTNSLSFSSPVSKL